MTCSTERCVDGDIAWLDAKRLNGFMEKYSLMTILNN